MPYVPLRDEDGTPIPALFRAREKDRTLAELIGLVKGIVCDGAVTDGEAVAVDQWLKSHPVASLEYPGRQIAERLQRVFQDGIRGTC